MLVEEMEPLTQSKFSSGLGAELSEIPFRDPIFASNYKLKRTIQQVLKSRNASYR